MPRYVFQDMVIPVPESGLGFQTPGLDHIRGATFDDVSGILALEMEVSGITREQDYRYFIENALGFWHISVYEGDIEGFLASCGHPDMNMIGPGVSRTEDQAATLILRELDQHRWRSPAFVVPVEKEKLVRQIYDWGGRNCELHFCQVRGDFQPYRGVNLSTFLTESA